MIFRLILCFLIISSGAYCQDLSINKQKQLYFMNGEYALQQKKYGLSEAYFDSCLQIDPLHFEAHYSRAIARENQQNYDGAINDYGAMVHLDPSFTEAIWSRAILRYQIGHYELAYEDFQSLLEIPEDETNAVYFSRKYPDQGVSSISTLETMRGQIFNYLGMVAHQLQIYPDALENYAKAFELDSVNADILVNRSQTYEASGSYLRAINDLKLALQLDPEYTLAKYNLVRLQENQSQDEELIETYTSILSDNPRFAEAFAKRGLAKMNSGDLEGALDDYDTAIYLDDKDALKWLNRGIIHTRMSFFEHAYSDLSHAISLQPDMENAYLNRANVLMKLGRFEEARKDYDIAILYYPDFDMAFYNRGIANHNLGNRDQACADIKKSLDLGFDQAEATLRKMCN